MADELEHGLGDYLLAAQAQRIRELETVLADRWRGELAIDGLANLRAILDDQSFQNSVLTVIEIKTILENKGGLMPDEAIIWFRVWQAERKNKSGG
jgi:hypothetical protein